MAQLVVLQLEELGGSSLVVTGRLQRLDQEIPLEACHGGDEAPHWGRAFRDRARRIARRRGRLWHRWPVRRGKGIENDLGDGIVLLGRPTG